MKKAYLLIACVTSCLATGCVNEPTEQAPITATGLAVAEKPIFVKLPKKRMGRAAGPARSAAVSPLPFGSEPL